MARREMNKGTPETLICGLMVNWDIVSRYQKLSKSFIEEFSNYINQEQLLLNEHVPEEFKDKPSEYTKFIEEIFKNK